MNSKLSSYHFQPVAVVRSCFKTKFGIPRQPGLISEARGSIELLPPYNQPNAVRGLEDFSHIWVLFVFHESLREGWKATVRPPRLGGDKRVGVFASRSPFRPCPIGLSVLTLRDVLSEDGPLDPFETGRIMAQVLRALDYSHDHGIIHRDIKPANVMLAQNGQPKVMDFGIARAIADTAATMTNTSVVVGTAQYLSPEQAQGHEVDARSDLYSAGCLLYELLTGRPPFVGDSPVAIAYQHVGEPPQPPSVHASSIPASLDVVTMTFASRDKARRISTFC